MLNEFSFDWFVYFFGIFFFRSLWRSMPILYVHTDFRVCENFLFHIFYFNLYRISELSSASSEWEWLTERDIGRIECLAMKECLSLVYSLFFYIFKRETYIEGERERERSSESWNVMPLRFCVNVKGYRAQIDRHIHTFMYNSYGDWANDIYRDRQTAYSSRKRAK